MKYRGAVKASVMVGSVLALSVMYSQGALAGISDTKHNFSTTNAPTSVTRSIYSSDQPEICIFCHTPHDAIKNPNIILWNHEISTVTQYGVYDSPSFDGAVSRGGDIAELGGVDNTSATASNLCLSCHDGTIAINSFNNPSNANPTTTMVGVDSGTGGIPSTSKTNLGTDLTNDHPVNFSYTTALANQDGTLNDPGAQGDALPSVRLFNNKLQCASCHDPHTSAQKTFLRASMAGSGLCLICHNK